jgi:hypothetical protein
MEWISIAVLAVGVIALFVLHALRFDEPAADLDNSALRRWPTCQAVASNTAAKCTCGARLASSVSLSSGGAGLR